MVPNGTKSLRCPERDVDSDDDYDDENSSYEDESISDDEEESYISYYSQDQLTVILEETDQDLLEEMSIRGSTSCRCRHESYKFVEDIPPSPPVRRWSEEMELKNNNNMESITLSPQSSSCRTSTTSNVTESSQSTTTTDNRFLPPFTYSGDSRISNGSEIRSWDGDDYDYDDDDDSSCFSEPLNDLPSTCRRGEPKFGTRQHGAMDESMQGSSYISLSLQGSSLVSLQNHGDGTYFVSPSDDEYTFVSCTTGDDMSLVSDVGSSRHARSVVSMDEIEGDQILQSTDEQHSCTLNDSGFVGSALNRRMSGLSIDVALLSPIPEGDSSDDENPYISQQPLNYQLVQKKLSSQIQSSLAKICECETLLLDESNTASSHRLIALKRRLQLERYGGVRRRRTFERAKSVLGKKLKHPARRFHCCHEPQTRHGPDYDNEIVSPLDDNLARFGGLTRRESFHRNKSTFEKRFDRDIISLTKPLRRRHSLSPVRRHSSFDKADFHLRMSKSESQLIVDMHEAIDQLQEHSERATCLHKDSEFEERFKLRQERFGGLGRRKSFNRSRRFLKKKFERIQARSQEDKERFGGLQRMASYKQSRKLFEHSIQGSRWTHSPLNSSERVTNLASDYEACDTNIGKSSIDVNGSKIIATICSRSYRIPCGSLRQI